MNLERLRHFLKMSQNIKDEYSEGEFMMKLSHNSCMEDAKLVVHQKNDSGGLHIVLEYLTLNST